jgi:type IV pilus assembly protein PilM
MFSLGKPHQRDVVTLAVESSDLRYLSTKGGKAARWGSVPLPRGLVVEGLITDAAEMGRLVNDLFEAENLDRKHVVTSLSALRSIPRLLTMPRLQASLLEEAISREARKEMPISLENLYLSWQSMPGVGEQQRVYMLGVPRDLVDAQVRSLESAAIAPYVMDLKPLALIRAVNQAEAIIVNLEETSLDIVLVVDYLPAIMRTFSLERETLDDAARLERLQQELSQTIRFYNDSHSSASIRSSVPVFASGRLFVDDETNDTFRAMLGTRTLERVAAPLPVPKDLPLAEYVTNLGLALKKV